MDSIQPVRVRAVEGAGQTEREDALAVEEPLEIRLRDAEAGEVRTFAITMRTPGQDEALAAGLLFAEGVLASRDDLLDLSRPSDPRIDPELAANVLVATLSPQASGRAEKLRRGTVIGSACGVCGKTSIENVIPSDRPPLVSGLDVRPETLYALPGRLRERQSIFSRTGGLHAGALFDGSGMIGAIAEDIGRHNATDKLVGGAFLSGELPLDGRILMVSGRAGFEIVQKAFAAGIPIVASVSAPSSLAVELADAGGVTLVGFLRGERFNVYTHANRIRAND
ncbi:MAG: formate dehydrogenase accessory sulfurtransferase FdhD [Acidobacteriota bacterium]|nr:formate dehydrogenase accessory sulfurtransferase FdhD [Acidobacteriota bacterium]